MLEASAGSRLLHGGVCMQPVLETGKPPVLDTWKPVLGICRQPTASQACTSKNPLQEGLQRTEGNKTQATGQKHNGKKETRMTHDELSKKSSESRFWTAGRSFTAAAWVALLSPAKLACSSPQLLAKLQLASARLQDRRITKLDVREFFERLKVREDRPQRGYNSFIPPEPMHQVQVDLADMGTFGSPNYKHKLVAIDSFSKKVAAVPLANN